MNKDISADIETLSSLYAEYVGVLPTEVKKLPGAGSNRRYYRLTGKMAMIGVAGNDIDENRVFIYLSTHFREKGLPVPEIYAADSSCGYYLQEDLGTVALFDVIAPGRIDGEWTEDIFEILKSTVRRLPDLQWRGIAGLDLSRLPVPSMDRRSIMWDLNYFKYCFLKPSGITFNEGALEDDFDKLTSQILSMDNHVFMYRDFQSRNVMVRDGEPWFIDFQGGRCGPCLYDVASFLWQARACYPVELREKLINEYIDSVSRYEKIDAVKFRNDLDIIVFFRLLQVLGAYGFRGNFEGKVHFIQSIPGALDNLKQLLPVLGARFEYLCEVLNNLVNLPQFQPPMRDDVLTVKVSSFGYRKSGIPRDNSGNGGGFVFDCRALHNPGRYEEYKSLTGRDKDVMAFLETHSDIADFLSETSLLVDRAVRTYRKRGFTDLMVNFGCTGGQHRSVYCAEKMAHRLHELFPGIRVVLHHIEQNIIEKFNPAL